MAASRASLRLLATLLSGVVLVLAGLGVWQVQRLGWKLDLIARTEARLAAETEAAPEPELWPSLGDEDEYTQVTVSGHFAGQDVLVKAVTELGPGFWVMTPLTTPEGWTVLINRGFVPADPEVADYRPVASEPVTLYGLLRLSQPGGGFLRANDPEANRWYSRDTAAIALTEGLGPVAPYFIDRSSTGEDFPRGGLTVVQFRNHHLQYALTWFAMAGLLAGMIVWMLRRG